MYPSTAEYSHIFYDQASNLKEFKENFVSSKLWRLNNLYTIIDKVGKTVPFIMNTAQHLVYSTSLTHPRLIILKSRQQGISTLWLISFFDDALFNKNFSVGLMAQGLDESSKLLERIGVLWKYIDIDVLKMLDVNKGKDNSKEFSFDNGSTFVTSQELNTRNTGVHPGSELIIKINLDEGAGADEVFVRYYAIMLFY